MKQAEKKFGLDPTKERAQNEKYSDMARGEFEKKTGKDIPAKVCSNIYVHCSFDVVDGWVWHVLMGP